MIAQAVPNTTSPCSWWVAARSGPRTPKVKRRFAAFDNVKVVQGFVPQSFEQGLPDKIAFAHIDMNNALAEIGALDAIAERLTPGAVIVLDDFGAIPYRPQHVAETRWFAERGIPVLELPTSQGLAIW